MPTRGPLYRLALPWLNCASNNLPQRVPSMIELPVRKQSNRPRCHPLFCRIRCLRHFDPGYVSDTQRKKGQARDVQTSPELVLLFVLCAFSGFPLFSTGQKTSCFAVRLPAKQRTSWRGSSPFHPSPGLRCGLRCGGPSFTNDAFVSKADEPMAVGQKYVPKMGTLVNGKMD